MTSTPKGPKPFYPQDVVICRSMPVVPGLTLAGRYTVNACAWIGGRWMVHLKAPHDLSIDLRTSGPQWYSADRFVKV